MHLGGAERALLGLLSTIDYEKYEIDLFLNRHEGELLEYIPHQVNILPADARYESLAEPIGQTLRRGQVGIAFCRTIAKIAASIKNGGIKKDGGISVDYSCKYTKFLMPKIREDTVYDLAISFITPHYFVTEKVNANTKVAWIHTDYSQISLDIKSQNKMWAPYNRIIAVSDDVAKSFCAVFPQLSDRIEVIENIQPENMIRSQAEEAIDDFRATDSFRLLSVGRFMYAKNFESIPEIVSILNNLNVRVKWYIIGYGGGEESIRTNIQKWNVERQVIILGKRTNPYPYIKRCDLYVQPSRYEGKAVTVREAQLLGKPVVITGFPTAHSQLNDGVDGIIVPMSPEGCAKGIAALLTDTKKMEYLANNCKNGNYSASSEIIKVYSLLHH